MGRAQIRPARHRVLKTKCGFLQPSQRRVGIAEIVVGVPVLWTQRKCALVMLDGFVVSAKCLERVPQTGVCGSGSRITRDRLAEQCPGVFELPLLDSNCAQPVECPKVPRAFLQDRTE